MDVDDVAARVAQASALLQRWVDTTQAMDESGGQGPPPDGRTGFASPFTAATLGAPRDLFASPGGPAAGAGFTYTRGPHPPGRFGLDAEAASRGSNAFRVAPLSRSFPVPPAQHAADVLGLGLAPTPGAAFNAFGGDSFNLASQCLPLPPPPLPQLLDAPPAAIAAALLGGDPTGPVESAFAGALGVLETDPASAPAAFESAARRCASAARQAATTHLHRGGPLVTSLCAEADALDAEAGTWALVDHLLGNAALRDRQAGDAEAQLNAGTPLGGTLAARCRAAARGKLQGGADGDVDEVGSVARLGRLVAWLECLAGVHLDRGGGGDAHTSTTSPSLLSRFGPSDGCWAETRRAVEQGATGPASHVSGVLVSELDFDVASRTGKQLHPANVDDEARLHAACFALLRAGRLQGAQALCVAVGQPWRAASYGAGAGFAPAPVGLAAEAACAEEHDGAAPGDDNRVLAALAAELDGSGDARARALWKWACTAAADAAASTGSTSEAGVYGCLAGDVGKLAALVDGDWHGTAWAQARCLLDARVDAALRGAADWKAPGPALGGSGSGADHDAPRWPTEAVLAKLPGDLAACLPPCELPSPGTLLASSADVAPGVHVHLQRCLALGQWETLLEALEAWALPEAATSAGGPPPSSPLRCAAHLLLALRALAPRQQVQGSSLGTTCDRLVVEYAALLASHERLALVPRYGAHVAAPAQRLPLMLRFWQLLSQSTGQHTSADGGNAGPEPLALRARCFDDAVTWLGMDGPGGVHQLLVRLLAWSRTAVIDDALASPSSADVITPAAQALVHVTDRLRALEWAAFGGEATQQLTADAAAALCADIGCSLCSRGASEWGNATTGGVPGPGDSGEEDLGAAQECLQEIVPPQLLAAASAGQLGVSGAALVAWGALFGAEQCAAQWRRHVAARLEQGGGHVLPSEARAAALLVDACLSTARSKAWLRGCWGLPIPGDAYSGVAPAEVSLLLRVTAPAGCTGPHACAALQAVLTSTQALAHAGIGPQDVRVDAAPLAVAFDGGAGDLGDDAAVVHHGVALRITCTDTYACLRLTLLALRGVSGGSEVDTPELQLPSVCIRLLDAQPSVLHAEVCRHIVVPHLLLRAAAAEAVSLGTLSATLEAVADPVNRLARLCAPSHLKALLSAARQVAPDAADGQTQDL